MNLKVFEKQLKVLSHWKKTTWKGLDEKYLALKIKNSWNELKNTRNKLLKYLKTLEKYLKSTWQWTGTWKKTLKKYLTSTSKITWKVLETNFRNN